jgi:DNA polymerase I-like protein with 3'-5' exonuclease and polymerase domains
MTSDYQSGDFYMAAAERFRMVRRDDPQAKRDLARDVAKTLSLGLNYYMSAFGLAHRLDIGYAEAEELLRKHRKTYATFWEFSDAVVNGAMLNCRLSSPFGWLYHVTGETRPRSLRNWMMQSGGSDLLRLAVILLDLAGIRIIGLVHDAVVIEAPEAEIEDHVALAKSLMIAASEVVTGGLRIRVDDPKIFRSGERFYDPKGVPMWNRIVRILRETGDQPSGRVSTARGRLFDAA